MSLSIHSISNFAEILADDPNCKCLARDVCYTLDPSRLTGATIGPMQSYEHSLVAESACILVQLGQVAQAASNIFSDIQLRTGEVTRRLDKLRLRVRKTFDESNIISKKFSDSSQFGQLLLKKDSEMLEAPLESTMSVLYSIVGAGDTSNQGPPPSPLSQHVMGQNGRVQKLCSNLYMQSLQQLPKDLPLLDKLEKHMQYPLGCLYSHPDGYFEDWMENLNELKRQKKARRQEKALALPSSKQRTAVQQIAKQTSKDEMAFIGRAAVVSLAVRPDQPVFYDVSGSKDMLMFSKHPVDFHASQYSGSGPPPSFLVGNSAPPPPSAKAAPLQPRHAPPRPVPVSSEPHESPSQPQVSPTPSTSLPSENSASSPARPPPPPVRSAALAPKPAPPPPPRPISAATIAPSPLATPAPRQAATPPPPPPPPVTVNHDDNHPAPTQPPPSPIGTTSAPAPPPPPPPPVSAPPPPAPPPPPMAAAPPPPPPPPPSMAGAPPPPPPPPPPMAGAPPPPPPPPPANSSGGGGGGGGNALMAAIAGGSGIAALKKAEVAPKAAGGERSFLDDIKKMDVSRLKKKDERVLAEKKPEGPQDEMRDRLQKFRGLLGESSDEDSGDSDW